MENKTENTSRRFSWSGLSILFSGIAFIVLCVAFYMAFYRIAFLGKQLQHDIMAAQQRADVIQSSINSVRQDTKQSLDAMTQSITELRQSINSDNNTWHILEAQYYVKLADAKLKFESNISAAIQLLQAADKEIHSLNDPRLDTVRKTLATDIVNLQAAPQIDYTGLYMRLYALDQELNKLPMVIRSVNNNVVSTSVINHEPWWKRGLQQSWQMLQKIVVIRYHASGAPPFITPDQQDFLLQNCHAMFEKAMWAVLSKQTAIYHASLQQIANWVSRYFTADASATKSMLDNIGELQQIDVHPVVSGVTASLQAFNDYLANMKNTSGA
jgi:uroporphyrin-III C-methyltransferase